VTIDEELTLLEENVRRLKVEYDIYFGGGARRAPTDLDWRVQGLIKKYSDSQKLSAQQRFKYNTVVQRYATYSDLWRQKLRIREEGYRRPQDALLGIQGLRPVVAAPSPQRAGLADTPKQVAVLLFADSDELEGIRELYQAIQSGAGGDRARGSLEAFAAFLRAKTKEIQNTYGCSGVEYTVEVKNGRAQIKARPNV
jgi:hypothetical protein